MNVIWQWITTYWKAHGTKLLGLATGFAAFAQVCADDILHVTPEGYRPFAHMAIMALAAATVKRGFTNTANSS